jgi:polysaccharide pyruvyl transferase WcaK-like protein
MRVHIGHHFFGSGNIGDDWMLAGFFAALAKTGAKHSFSCCTPFDRASQARRFPEVEWLSYDSQSRRAAIGAADVWLGLGDTPFQSDTGSWFIEHLLGERTMCQERHIPMWFLGVGVNNREVFVVPEVRSIAQSAAAIWTRDAGSAEWIAAAVGRERVTVGADLSHAWFLSQSHEHESRHVEPAETAENVALCLNFEDRGAFEIEAIEGVITQSGFRRLLWLVQEIRPLNWSEHTLLAMLGRRTSLLLTVIEPDYENDSTRSLGERWGHPDIALSSRYHATVALAWRGARLATITRNDKVRALAEDLDLPSIASLTNAEAAIAVLGAARRVPRDRLERRARGAERMVADWVDAASSA